MKNLIILTSLMFSFFLAKSEKLTVIDQDWDKAQQVAKQKDKLIIIDFYATWCVPCRAFEVNLKKSSSLKHYLAKDFILFKYDAEKDKQYNLSKKFHIGTFPTFVVVTPELQYIDRLEGGTLRDGIGINRFTAFTKRANKLYATKTYPLGYDTKVDKEYPLFYVKAMNQEWRYNQTAIDNYWKNTKDYSSEVSFAVYSVFGGNPLIDEYFTKHKPIFDEKFGKSATKSIEDRISYEKIKVDYLLTDKNEQPAEESIAYVASYPNTEIMKQSLPVLRVQQAVAQNDCDRLESLMNEFVESNYNLEPATVAAVGWEVYKAPCKKISLLSRTIDLMDDFVKGKKDYHYMDTYACVLHKSGKYRAAKNVMEAAINYAKKEGIDYSNSRSLYLISSEEVNH